MSEPLTIQDAIDFEIAGIAAVVSAKFRRNIPIKFKLMDGISASWLVYCYDKGNSIYLSGFGCKTIDDALSKALAHAQALRTIEDENADLGLAEEDEPQEELIECDECTCSMSVVHSTDIDPPEMRVDPHCPTHGRYQDPDRLRDERIDREMEEI